MTFETVAEENIEFCGYFFFKASWARGCDRALLCVETCPHPGSPHRRRLEVTGGVADAQQIQQELAAWSASSRAIMCIYDSEASLLGFGQDSVRCCKPRTQPEVCTQIILMDALRRIQDGAWCWMKRLNSHLAK